MNFYETLYIIHPALESGRLKDIIMGVEDSLKKMGGEPLAVELWGKRKLSHYIDKQKYGTYVLLQFNGEGKCTGDFAVELEHNPNILAYLTTAIDQNDVLEQEEDLDTQIAGKTREVVARTDSSALKTETISKDAVGNDVSKTSGSEESIQENSRDIETNDEKKNPEEEPAEASLKDKSDEQVETAEQESKDEESEHEDKGAANDDESLEKEVSKKETADKTSDVDKEE
jgi:ribosomal protein S6